MTLLFLAPFGFSWLLMASAGLPCSSTESEGQGGCANQKALGAALVQMKTLHSSMRVVADEGEDGQNTGLGHALDLVTVLADKSGGHSWNMSSDERLALQTIKDMIQDLFNGSLIQFREDQLEVDAARDRISNCTNDVRNTHNDVITPKKQKADQSRTEHKQCRERENKIIANTSQECTTYHNYRTTESNFDPFPTCMSTQLTFAKISTTDDTVLQSMESCLVDTIKTLRPLYHEHAGCKESNDLRKNVSVECKREQGEFEADFCHYASQLATKCNTYSGCRSTSVGARNSTHAAVEKSESARKADWKTGTHIQCLLGVFESDNVNKSALLKDCAWANVSTSNITIAYHAIPPEDPCPVEGNEPCDNAWLQTEYTSKAWYNSSTISACTPCQGPTPSPPPLTCLNQDRVGEHLVRSNQANANACSLQCEAVGASHFSWEPSNCRCCSTPTQQSPQAPTPPLRTCLNQDRVGGHVPSNQVSADACRDACVAIGAPHFSWQSAAYMGLSYNNCRCCSTPTQQSPTPEQSPTPVPTPAPTQAFSIAAATGTGMLCNNDRGVGARQYNKALARTDTLAQCYTAAEADSECVTQATGVVYALKANDPSGLSAPADPTREGRCGCLKISAAACHAGNGFYPYDAIFQRYMKEVLVLWDGPVHQDLTVSPGTVGDTGGTSSGWNMPASASLNIADGSDVRGISFKVTSATSHFIIGWSSSNTDASSNYGKLDNGIIIRGSYSAKTPEVMEHVATKYSGNLANNGDWANDVYSMVVNSNGKVDYMLNGNVFYTSTSSVVYPWHAFIDVYYSTSPSTVHEVKYV